MWVDATPAGAPAADKSTAAPGPLQAFGQVHRALRDSEKRITSINHEVKESQANLSKTTRRLQADGKRLREDLSQQLADLEELVLQVYEEHEQAIERERDAAAKAKAELAAEQVAHRAALVAQQGQIDALAAALRRQQEVLDEHINGTAAQMAAVQAESSELHRAFKAQGAAVQATKGFISSVDEKLSAQIEDRAKATDAALEAAAEGWTKAFKEHAGTLERLSGWETSQRAAEDRGRDWRRSVDEKLGLLEHASAAAQREAEAARVSVHAELGGRVDACAAGLRDVEERLPSLVEQLRSELAASAATRANAAETEERFGVVEEQLAAARRQIAPLTPEVHSLASRVASVEAAVGEAKPAEQRRARELDALTEKLAKVTAELNEARQANRVHRQHLSALQVSDEGRLQAQGELEARVRQVHAMADEHARFLVSLGDALHTANVAAPRFRGSALSLPSFDPASSAAALRAAEAVGTGTTLSAGGHAPAATAKLPPSQQSAPAAAAAAAAAARRRRPSPALGGLDEADLSGVAAAGGALARTSLARGGLGLGALTPDGLDGSAGGTTPSAGGSEAGTADAAELDALAPADARGGAGGDVVGEPPRTTPEQSGRGAFTARPLLDSLTEY